MQLAIDSGNTKSKFALFHKGEIIKKQAVFNNEAISFLKELLTKNKALSTAIVSCVSELKKDFLSTLEAQQVRTLNLTENTKTPIQNTYKTPETLGRDRLAMVIGAHELYPNENILVVSFGSCITYNFLKNSTFVGGAISPGIYQRFHVLNQKTADLPLLEAKKNIPIIGKNTNESILSGVLNGARAEVSGMIGYYKQNEMLNKVIFTGGDAIYFEAMVKNATFVHPDIVLKGLKCILDFNNIL